MTTAALAVFSSCDGPQSALSPAGSNADQLAELFWAMTIGAVAVWLIVVGLGMYSLLRPETGSRRKAAIFIIGGGAIFPTVVLAALLTYGLSLLPGQVAPAPEGSLQIDVVGQQWWWRVRYRLPGEESAIDEPAVVELANEIHLPVGEPVQFNLQSADVVHSFWIPSLGGKVDMIPGRQTRLTLHPTRRGIYRGVCAEYCGGSHALMTFYVIVEDREQFERWLERQSGPAVQPESPLAIEGQRLFLASGCGACHAVRGTAAKGTLGPDLTHVGSRRSLGDGIIANEPESFLEWIKHPESLKPEARMPRFNMLPPDELRAMATFLDGLE